jgi:hypothetical protein
MKATAQSYQKIIAVPRINFIKTSTMMTLRLQDVQRLVVVVPSRPPAWVCSGHFGLAISCEDKKDCGFIHSITRIVRL